jgi:hypothetical protein
MRQALQNDELDPAAFEGVRDLKERCLEAGESLRVVVEVSLEAVAHPAGHGVAVEVTERQGKVGPVAKPQQAAVFRVVQIPQQAASGAVEAQSLQGGPRIAGNPRFRKVPAPRCGRGAVRARPGFDFWIIERHQKSIRVANCMRLGWPARRSLPKYGPLSGNGSG